MPSPVPVPKRVSSEKYVPVHKRSPSSTSSSSVRQIPVSDTIKTPPIYSIAELLQLSKSPLVQTSLTSKQRQRISDVMAYISQPRRQTNSRSPSPTKSSRSPSPIATESKRASSPMKAKKSLAPETVPLPKIDTPPSPRRRPSKRRPAETTNAHLDSVHRHHRRRQWGYTPSFHHNEHDWRAHPGVTITA